jgi:head-tail adaptor
MARLKQFDIGTSIPVVVEKWQQGKNDKGSNTEIYVSSFTAYANVDNLSSLRVFEDGQLKQAETFEMIVRKRNLKPNDVNVLWKVKFYGKRHTVTNKVSLNKANTDFLLTVLVK